MNTRTLIDQLRTPASLYLWDAQQAMARWPGLDERRYRLFKTSTAALDQNCGRRALNRTGLLVIRAALT